MVSVRLREIVAGTEYVVMYEYACGKCWRGRGMEGRRVGGRKEQVSLVILEESDACGWPEGPEKCPSRPWSQVTLQLERLIIRAVAAGGQAVQGLSPASQSPKPPAPLNREVNAYRVTLNPELLVHMIAFPRILVVLLLPLVAWSNSS